MSLLNKSMGLSFYELIGDANNINSEINRYEIIDQNSGFSPEIHHFPL